MKQYNTAIRLALSTLPTRRGASLVVVIGMACAVGALVSVQSMSTGISQMVNANGRTDRAIVLSRGAPSEGPSAIPRDAALTIADAPGIKHDTDGKPIVSADTTANIVVLKKSDGYETFLTVRGVGLKNFTLRPEIKLTSGRTFQPGKYEVIAGKAAQEEFQGLEEGSKLELPEGEWTVVGTFDDGGGIMSSTVLTDADTLLSSMRGSAYKSVRVMLDSPARMAAFKSALTTNPTLTVDVVSEAEYSARQSRQLNGLLTAVAVIVGGIMGLGAMFGTINTMYSAVSARSIEIATLRAIGFGGGAVAASILIEALALVLVGALIGSAFAWAAFNGNSHVFGNLVIHLAVTPGLVIRGVVFACVLGFIGGVFPAVRAARIPVATALRAT